MDDLRYLSQLASQRLDHNSPGEEEPSDREPRVGGPSENDRIYHRLVNEKLKSAAEEDKNSSVQVTLGQTKDLTAGR